LWITRAGKVEKYCVCVKFSEFSCDFLIDRRHLDIGNNS